MARDRWLPFVPIVALALASTLAAGQQQEIRAPNVVRISSALTTSGQPSVQELKRLAAAGFQAVLYLAPSTVPDAVADEGTILQSQGIEFIHIPIPFGEPQEAHYLAVASALSRLSSKKTLVHCQVNMRASSMVFLYRTLVLRESPAPAYEAVAQVWSPQGPWLALIQAQLRKHGVDFQPY